MVSHVINVIPVFWFIVTHILNVVMSQKTLKLLINPFVEDQVIVVQIIVASPVTLTVSVDQIYFVVLNTPHVLNIHHV